MWATLGQLLPIAMAVSLSTVPILATIVLLLAPGQGRASLAFLIGWSAGLFVTLAAVTAVTYLFPIRVEWSSDAPLAAVLIATGAAVIVYAVIAWRRSAGAPAKGLPRWLSAVGSLKAPAALGVGFALTLRPKGLLLTIAAAVSVRGNQLTWGEAAIAIAIYTALSASSVAGPVFASRLRPERTRRQLEAARSWLATHSRIVSFVVMLLIGTVVIGYGVARL